MDQIKIGKFIAECRKAKSLTQVQLAEKLNITDRAVSKWETGKALPDSSIMLELCGILGITVNDLLNGERISSENYTQKVEAQMLELLRQTEQSGKQLDRYNNLSQTALTIISFFALIVLLFVPDEKMGISIIGVCLGLIMIVSGSFAIFFDINIGYYQCPHCDHIYRPKIFSLFHYKNFFSVRKIYLRCPHCKQYSRQEKIYAKPTKPSE